MTIPVILAAVLTAGGMPRAQVVTDGAATTNAQILMTYPLKSIGVEISMGNRIGCQFIGPGCAWNGGQWHSPASFQTLMLEMK